MLRALQYIHQMKERKSVCLKITGSCKVGNSINNSFPVVSLIAFLVDLLNEEKEFVS